MSQEKQQEESHPWLKLFDGCGAYYLEDDNAPFLCEVDNNFVNIKALDLFTTKRKINKYLNEIINDNHGDFRIAYATGVDLLKLVLETDILEIDEAISFNNSLAGLYIDQGISYDRLEVSSLESIRDALIIK